MMAEYIEREAATEIIRAKQKVLCPIGVFSRNTLDVEDREKFDAWEEILDALDAISAADVEPVRRGRWVPSKICRDYLVCSACGGCYVTPDWPVEGKWGWCPQCGAKMEGVDWIETYD